MEIRSQQLRFTTPEVLEWIASSGFTLSPAVVEKLVEKTEGWGAGIQLGMTLFQELPADAPVLVESLNGEHPYIFAYMMQEIFERQSNQRQLFLLQSSVLGQLNAAICKAVLACDDAQQTLDTLETDNLFLVRLNEQWYRYHPLFREFLLNRLLRTMPEEVKRLRLAAADYYRAHAEHESAVQYYLLAGNPNKAAQNLRHFALSYLDHGRLDVLSRYFSQISYVTLAAYPDLLLLYGRTQRQLGHLNDAVHLLEHVHLNTTDSDYLAAALIELASIARSQGNYKRGQELSSAAMTLCPQAGATRAFALMERAKCEGFLEGMDIGRKLAEEAVTEMRKVRDTMSPHHQAQLLRSLGQICWWHGDVNQAVIHCEMALKCLPDDQSPLAAHILLALAIPILYRHEYSTALSYAERALAIVQRLQLKELLSTSYTVLGNVLNRMGQLTPAENNLRQAIDLAELLGAASYDQVMAGSYLAYNLMMQGRVDEARQAAEMALWSHQDAAPVYEIYVCRSVLADTYLSEGRLAEAEKIFKDLIALGEGRQYRIPLAMSYFGLAYIYLSGGQEKEGTILAKRSLELLAPSQAWELYVDQGERTRIVFRHLQPEQHPLIRRVFAALEQKQAPHLHISDTTLRVKVTTLGSLRVFHGEQEIDPRTWVSARSRDLLAYFVTFRHEAMPLDRIIDALWGSDLRKGRAAFHTTLYRLRHSLRLTDEQTKFILTEAGDYRLDLTRFDIDVEHFDDLLRRANQSGFDESVACYTQALELYRGDYLNNLYYDWLVPERQRLNDLYLQALRGLEKLYASAGRMEEALGLARQALQRNPLVEAIHCDIMRYLHYLGDQKALVKQYQLLSGWLHDELGLDPLPETQRLFETLTARNAAK